MKQKQGKFNGLSGFTVIELLVVLSVMIVIATVIILDFNRQRTARNIILARNETVTSIRKIQNYMLTSKNIAEGVPAKFYIAQFDLTGSVGKNKLTVKAVDNDFTVHNNVETITLPSSTNYTGLKLEGVGKGAPPVEYNCLSIIFSAPFGKMYTYGASDCNENLALTLRDPVALSQLSQKRAYIELISGTNTATITINPVTGQITD